MAKTMGIDLALEVCKMIGADAKYVRQIDISLIADKGAEVRVWSNLQSDAAEEIRKTISKSYKIVPIEEDGNG